MNIPTKEEAKKILEEHVLDEYQKHHALMVATAMEGYAILFNEDPQLWFITGYLHDVDFHKHPEVHPGESLKWFKDWNYPEEMIHAVEAHAYGYNGYTTLPQSKLAGCLIACDEISGIFYAYKKLNPVKFSEMKASSILKRVKEKSFAPKIERETIFRGCEYLDMTLEAHVQNLINFFSKLD
jgi:predicted hydrolase (HD superfamily)